jgi:dienelactone hydrolase
MKPRHQRTCNASVVLLAFLLGGLGTTMSVAAAAEAAPAPGVIPMGDVLVIHSLGRAGRSPVHTDTLEARLVTGAWVRPVAGDTVPAPDGSSRKWEHAAADKNGVLAEGAARGAAYVYWPVVSAVRQVMLLEAAGDNLVYVNGEIRVGDPYAAGYVELPVLLQPGTNDFLFQASRGELRAKLVPAVGPVVIAPGDRTLPDLVLGETEPVWCGVVLLNATTNFAQVSLQALTNHSPEHIVTIPPLGTRKAPFLLNVPRGLAGGDVPVSVRATLRGGPRTTPAEATLELRVRRPDQTCKRTFISVIDDSVQYYAVNPMPEPPGPLSHNALFLSLHGASVEAIGQADAYSPKRWGPIVCPTNRRPYGFDWEEWGQWDALEVLGLAEARYHPDPTRIYLTGHSMGGHGTWQLGALFPDRFAAIGPSAGWISFTTYVSTNSPQATNAVVEMLRRASAASETLLMATNFLQEGVYILHGGADDNVPVTEARHMSRVLAAFHHDFQYHEQPGVGHWWDISDEPGADCVDWPPMFDFFAHHVIPSDVSLRRVQFVTVNPAVSARAHWVTVLAQEHSLEPSVVDLHCDPLKRRVVGTTTNVARLWLELPSLAPGAPVLLDLDGQRIENIPWPTNHFAPRTGQRTGRRTSSSAARALASAPAPGLLLVRETNQWRLAESVPVTDKNPLRSGPFREAFRNHMLFVYGTQGTPEENAWALRKARFDAETFWYRGNGSITLMADRDYLKNPAGIAGQPDRHGGAHVPNVILYGNADSNAAWPSLLASSPVQVQRGHVRIGSGELSGSDLACLFLRPNPHDNQALVGVVSGSGLEGLRLTERIPYFLSGAGFPDCLVMSVDALTKGMAGVRVAGFFGVDWQVAGGDFAWQEHP